MKTGGTQPATADGDHHHYYDHQRQQKQHDMKGLRSMEDWKMGTIWLKFPHAPPMMPMINCLENVCFHKQFL